MFNQRWSQISMVLPLRECLVDVRLAFLQFLLTSLYSSHCRKSVVLRSDLMSSSCHPASEYKDSHRACSSPSSNKNSCRTPVPAAGYWASCPSAHPAAPPRTEPALWHSLHDLPPCWESGGKGHELQLGWRVLGSCGWEESGWAVKRAAGRQWALSLQPWPVLPASASAPALRSSPAATCR